MADFGFWEYAIWLTGGMFFTGGIGALIGNRRGQVANGFALGALLGPVGWLITILLPEAGPKCPECLGVIPRAARRCKHCGVELRAPKVRMLRVPENNYYVLRGEKPDGPFSREELKLLVANGDLKIETLCAVDGGSAWFPVGTLA